MTNNQFQSLDSINCVEDISPEDAAAYSGGSGTVTLYDGFNQTGPLATLSGSVTNLNSVNFNDLASSITVTGNSTWKFWTNANFSGLSITLSATANTGGTAVSNNNLTGAFNNSFSSVQLIP